MEQIFITFGQSSGASDTAGGLAAGLLGLFFIVLWLAFFAAIIVGVVFWWISLIHLIQHDDVKDRTMWILLLFFVGTIMGFIYYFAVKRKYDAGGARELRA